jgi:hypothetical protein
MDMDASLNERIPTPEFHCIWGDHRVPVADAADEPATTCLGCLDEVAELEQRELTTSRREIA